MKGKTGIVSLHPIPAREILTLRFVASKEKNITITIVDASGKRMISEKRFVTKGLNTFSLQTARLRSGVFNLYVLGDNGAGYQEQFIKL